VDERGDVVELRSSPLDVAAAVAAVGDADGGAIAMFLGATRQETREDGRKLLGLEYEAYCEMAEAQMRRLAEGRGGAGRSAGWSCCIGSAGWKWGSRRC